jgi:inositol 1,4,5-triphosphate receptor type 1
VSTATTDRKHADVALENYVTETVMNVIYTFFSSPFSDQTTTLQVRLSFKFTYRYYNV